MAKLRLALQAQVDISEVRSYTEQKFGALKLQEYDELIESALEVLAENPRIGRQRPEIRSGAWTYHISKPGKKARHLFIYRINNDSIVEVARFLHDSMDLVRHLPESF